MQYIHRCHHWHIYVTFVFLECCNVKVKPSKLTNSWHIFYILIIGEAWCSYYNFDIFYLIFNRGSCCGVFSNTASVVTQSGMFQFVLIFQMPLFYDSILQWRHNGSDSVSNHQPHDCLLNRLFRRRSKKTPKLRVTGLCAGNSPGTGEFPAQMASNAGNVSIW